MTFDDDEKGRNIPDYLPETHEIIDLTKDSNKNYDAYIELKRGAFTHSFLKCESWPIYLALKERNHVNVLLNDESRAILLSIKISQTLSVVLIYGISQFHTLDEKHMEFLQVSPLTLMISPLDDVINACSQESSHLQIIRRNARRLLKLINTLLQNLIN
ncbi:hypothetical protein C2G38_2195012 [Gigaspora rosea]|uniref:Uncharacterized protein n=1 Tax=Gigaspora rosea TaxID=44941 RepID=A0A397V0I5_9GLOM|nr:hypothetical protein C2G38_2195012 [Gigaspora rosea]